VWGAGGGEAMLTQGSGIFVQGLEHAEVGQGGGVVSVLGGVHDACPQLLQGVQQGHPLPPLQGRLQVYAFACSGTWTLLSCKSTFDMLWEAVMCDLQAARGERGRGSSGRQAPLGDNACACM